MFSKVETLAVCCESGTVSVTRLFESMELGACCVRCVCIESRLLGASAGVNKLEYDAGVSCRRTRGKLVLDWL